MDVKKKENIFISPFVSVVPANVNNECCNVPFGINCAHLINLTFIIYYHVPFT